MPCDLIMTYTKEQQIGPKKEKKAKSIRPMTEDRAAMEAGIRKAYKLIHDTRPHNCEETGSPEYEHSHCFPKKPFIWLAAMPENIVLLNRAQHLLWEDNYLHFLPNTAEKSIDWMFHAVEHETDVKRKKMMSEFTWNKLHKCADRCMDDGEEVPEWVRRYLG